MPPGERAREKGEETEAEYGGEQGEADQAGERLSPARVMGVPNEGGGEGATPYDRRLATEGDDGALRSAFLLLLSVTIGVETKLTVLPDIGVRSTKKIGLSDGSKGRGCEGKKKKTQSVKK